MIRSENIGGGARKSQVLSSVGPGDAGSGIGNFGDLAGAKGIADPKERTNIVMTDLLKRGDDRKLRAIGRPGQIRNIFQAGTPPRTLRAIYASDVDAVDVVFRDVAHFREWIGRTRVGGEGEFGAVGRDGGTADAVGKSDDARGFATGDRNNSQLTLLIDFVGAVKRCAFPCETRRLKRLRQV